MDEEEGCFDPVLSVKFEQALFFRGFSGDRRQHLLIIMMIMCSADDTYEDDVIDLDSPGEEDEGAGEKKTLMFSYSV